MASFATLASRYLSSGEYASFTSNDDNISDENNLSEEKKQDNSPNILNSLKHNLPKFDLNWGIILPGVLLAASGIGIAVWYFNNNKDTSAV